jgi:hypothetical protein
MERASTESPSPDKQLHFLYMASPTPSSCYVLAFGPSKDSLTHSLHFQFLTDIQRAEEKNVGTMGVQWPILNPNTSLHSFPRLSVDIR